MCSKRTVTSISLAVSSPSSALSRWAAPAAGGEVCRPSSAASEWVASARHRVHTSGKGGKEGRVACCSRAKPSSTSGDDGTCCSSSSRKASHAARLGLGLLKEPFKSPSIRVTASRIFFLALAPVSEGVLLAGVERVWWQSSRPSRCNEVVLVLAAAGMAKPKLVTMDAITSAIIFVGIMLSLYKRAVHMCRKPANRVGITLDLSFERKKVREDIIR
mmetsp:Transcript_32610/g.47029  ORF Transcript_32610/g.47029 Transcript_32610/m.47029 type:complete len:217 (+) Transcript_32610:914-1564(+)